MARKQSKRGLIVTIIALVIVLLIVGAVVLAKKMNQPSTTDTTNTSKEVTPPATPTTETNTTDTDSSTTDTANPVVDPSTLTSIDVAPLGVTVFYTKGTPGFEYTVLKTADQTQYVQFTSADLIGTKCTDDQGAFASIVKNPSSGDTQTISQTIKVGNDTYGLSLSGSNCTGNAGLLTQYQTGFKNGFASLKAL